MINLKHHTSISGVNNFLSSDYDRRDWDMHNRGRLIFAGRSAMLECGLETVETFDDTAKDFHAGNGQFCLCLINSNVGRNSS